MDFQIVINDENETTFLVKDGRFQKSWRGVDYYTCLIFDYKNVKGLIKSAKKMMTNKSTVKAWNLDGSPNKEFTI